ncbi:hypothetical protein JKF63_07014 [Porcisia hertigi]|uniref:Uncharacterized protein n=1 Tax=Porcisia hertigi TaxID=2761500 RepID=A0A836IZQ7_9TRYP|nr:hypothetical protein JKF63_07014 [Porcisia hertigi]
MPRPSAQPHLRPSVHLSTKAANYELVAAANVSTPPPPPPPSSTFQEPRNSTTELDECHAYAVASVGGADSSRGTSMHSGNSSNCKKHGLPRASSGHGLTSLSQSQGKGYSESPPQPPQQPPFISSHLPAQLWTSTARVAGVDDVAAIRSSHHHHGYQQSFQTSRHSPPSLSQYPGGAISKPTTVVGPTLSARSVYTSSVSSHSVSSGHYSMNVTPPPSGSAHTFMLLPSSLENSVTGSSTHPPYCGYAMQVPVQSLPPSEVASASLYASSHSSGAMLSPSTMQSSSHATMAPGGGVDAVTLFYVGAPTALNGLPLMAAHSQVNTSPASSTSAQSCSFNVTPFSLPDSSALSSHYVYVQPYPPANHLQSLPLSLQQYTGHFASQLPNVGTAAAAASEQAASSSAHGRMSSAAGESAMAYLPHVTSTKSPPVSQQSGLTYPSIRPVCLSTNPELTRKQVNVHGAMLNVLPYYPYNENAPPAPTVHIVTGLGSLNNSIPTQPLAASRWSAQSANNNAESNPDLNWRSLDGVRGQGAGVISSCAHAGDMPALANAPVLPIFIQMFPCELRDRVGLLNRVIEMTCGRDAGVVQGFETRSETSFVAQVRTNKVWDLIYKLRCRVLMDRFGFWYAGDIDQYVRMKEYCEGVRRLPQQTRHFQTDGLPCMPLVVELSRSVDRSFLTENTAPRCFDEIVPIAAVDRHRARLQGLSSVQSSHASGGVSGGMAMATNGASPAGNAVCFTGVGGDSRSLPEGSPVSLTNEIHPMSGSPDNGYRAAGCSAPTLYADPQFLALSQGSGSKGKS